MSDGHPDFDRELHEHSTPIGDYERPLTQRDHERLDALHRRRSPAPRESRR